MNWFEIVGLVAGAVVLISFLFSNKSTISIVNIFSSALFVVYGVLLEALSVWLLNSILVLVHCWKLFKAYKNRTKLLKPSIVYNYQNKQMQINRREVPKK